jgi:uncharacterized protein YggU (UPF0235/DUF167 family)
MRLNVKVFPNAKEDKLVMEEGRSRVYLMASSVERYPNRALIKFLAKHFYVDKNKIRIISGKAIRTKLIEVKKG